MSGLLNGRNQHFNLILNPQYTMALPCKASTSKDEYKVILSSNAILIGQQKESQRYEQMSK